MQNKILPFIAGMVLFAACTNQPIEKPETEVVATDPLPSWNDGASKKAIIDFVTNTTTKGSAGFIPVADRIALLRQ